MSLEPQDLAQINKLMSDHDQEHEPWSFKKFFMGFFRMQNAAKAIVLGFWLCIILLLGYGVYRLTIKKPTTAIGTNSGSVVTNNEDKHGNSFSLFNVVNGR